MHVDVIHTPESSRFEARVEGQLCEADYELQDGVMSLTHTRVPELLQGRGIAAALIHAALDHAAARGLKVRPLCSYARQYMQRHPETQTLLAA
ncbi:N-acetyltransferase [Aquabacterium sp. A7-Y]|uniref:GNAT family N-acetyltransferase n=1 Tax=Aquabacterium sp. A7-Y TaxID=1349605 RepID=UPI00223E4F66|nr:GNAT family N-acetyltransferase [Aquabacterium sp. A7-Y]MCW7536583.1 N-acetyltransferase [Aquabacterium sp. A7-Y]